jgi:hypothetical protein
VKSRLTELPRALKAAGYETVPYRFAYAAAVGGDFPAEQINKIWHFNPLDLGTIAERLGLAPFEREGPDPLLQD